MEAELNRRTEENMVETDDPIYAITVDETSLSSDVLPNYNDLFVYKNDAFKNEDEDLDNLPPPPEYCEQKDSSVDGES